MKFKQKSKKRLICGLCTQSMSNFLYQMLSFLSKILKHASQEYAKKKWPLKVLLRFDKNSMASSIDCKSYMKRAFHYVGEVGKKTTVEKKLPLSGLKTTKMMHEWKKLWLSGLKTTKSMQEWKKTMAKWKKKYG